jgi:hypothetical protein
MYIWSDLYYEEVFMIDDTDTGDALQVKSHGFERFVFCPSVLSLASGEFF